MRFTFSLPLVRSNKIHWFTYLQKCNNANFECCPVSLFQVSTVSKGCRSQVFFSQIVYFLHFDQISQSSKTSSLTINFVGRKLWQISFLLVVGWWCGNGDGDGVGNALVTSFWFLMETPWWPQPQMDSIDLSWSWSCLYLVHLFRLLFLPSFFKSLEVQYRPQNGPREK